MQEEEQARRIVEPRDPVTGDTCFETSLRDQLERTHLQEVLQEREDKRNKQLEMTRSEVKTVQKIAHQRIFLVAGVIYTKKPTIIPFVLHSLHC